MRLGLCLVVSLVACDAALGIEVLPRQSEAPVVYASAACSACANACSAERSVCSRNGACDTLQRCSAQCAANDARCRMTCERASPLAVSAKDFMALDHCLRGKCTESCLGVTGMGSIFGPECACLDGPCGSETLTCLRAGTADAAGVCERSLSCIARNGLDPDHAQECLLGTKIDSEIGDLRRCWSTVTCPACPLAKGGALNCVGAYRWQVPSTPTVHLAMNITTFDNARTPVEGVTVKVCNAGSCADCPAPKSAKTTDAKGNVGLDLPTGVTGFGGCLHVNKPGLVPMIVSSGYPIVRNMSFNMFVIDATTLPVLGKFIGTETMPDRGHLVSIAGDCVNSPVSGMRIEVEPTDAVVRSGYFINNGLDVNAKETGSLGTTLFVNLPSRVTPPSIVSAFHGDRLISRNYATIVPGTISVLFSVPRTAD